MADVEFETIKAEEMKFGKNNFLEVARKRAVSQDGSNEFIAISRGYFLPDGTKRFRRSLAVPDEAGIIEFIVRKLNEFHSDAPAAEKPAEEKPKEEAPAEDAPAEESQPKESQPKESQPKE